MQAIAFSLCRLLAFRLVVSVINPLNPFKKALVQCSINHTPIRWDSPFPASAFLSLRESYIRHFWYHYLPWFLCALWARSINAIFEFSRLALAGMPVVHWQVPLSTLRYLTIFLNQGSQILFHNLLGIVVKLVGGTSHFLSSVIYLSHHSYAPGFQICSSHLSFTYLFPLYFPLLVSGR